MIWTHLVDWNPLKILGNYVRFEQSKLALKALGCKDVDRCVRENAVKRVVTTGFPFEATMAIEIEAHARFGCSLSNVSVQGK